MRRFLLLFTLCLFGVSADSHIFIGHAGDDWCLEFKTMAVEILAELRQSPLPGIDNDRLAIAIEKTELLSVDKSDLLIDKNHPDHQVSAVNFPESNPPQIIFSREEWDKSSFEIQSRLVLHEYLSIAHIDDRNFRLSSQLQRPNICSRHPVIRDAISNWFGGINCKKIDSNDLKGLLEVNLSTMPDTLEMASIRPNDVTGLTNKFFDFGGKNSFLMGHFPISAEVTNLLQNVRLVVPASYASGTGLQSFYPVGFQPTLFLKDYRSLETLEVGYFNYPFSAEKEIIFPTLSRKEKNLLSIAMDQKATNPIVIAPSAFAQAGPLEKLILCQNPYAKERVRATANAFKDLEAQQVDLCLRAGGSAPLEEIFSGAHIGKLVLEVDNIFAISAESFVKLQATGSVQILELHIDNIYANITKFKGVPGLVCEEGSDYYSCHW